jgi:hypothetical protein
MSDFDKLVFEWGTVVDKKWSEVRQTKGHLISAYSPQLTMKEDDRSRHETTLEVIRWTESWFAERGCAVKCVIQADQESFSVEPS